MATSNSSRKRPTLEDSGGSDDTTQDDTSGDPVIGLDVGGRVFFTHQSTLTKASSYFQAKFGGNFHAGHSYIDCQRGWTVYFIDADPDLFQIILSFLRTGIKCWPSPYDNPVLHRRLQQQAEYFAIDSMIQALQVSFKPNLEGKGIMYWLGTQRGKEEYRNPYETGVIELRGSCKKVSDEILNDEGEWDDGGRLEARDSQKYFVEHCPTCMDLDYFERPMVQILNPHSIYTSLRFIGCRCFLNYCDHSAEGKDVIISLPNDILVKPSHYSLRYGECYGMSDWNFEGSTDGINWETLHQVRNENHILGPGSKMDELRGIMRERCAGIPDDNGAAKQAIATAIAEEHLRHTWVLKDVTVSFYKHFRFVGRATKESYSRCMHAVGFELYGTVNEEEG